MTNEKLIAELRAQPGIDVTKLAKGNLVTVETTLATYQFLMESPAHCLMLVSGSIQQFEMPCLGQLIESVTDQDRKVGLPGWIGKGLRMQIRFKNGIMNCSAAVRATVEGVDWFYDVF